MRLRPLQRRHQDPEAGDACCWIGLERHSKLVLAWHLGRRTRWDAHDFMEKLDAATGAGRFQLTTTASTPTRMRSITTWAVVVL
jgi:hypothetical protein